MTLGYDTSLFSGPSWNPNWPSMYHDQVSPVSSLWVQEGRVTPFEDGPRVHNAPRAAATTFAAELAADGITVRSVSATTAPAKAPTIAAIDSLPLKQIVEHCLLVSDNDAAEVLFRQSALAAGHPGTFSGGQQAVRDTLAGLGVWEVDAKVYDGSGLSRQGQVPPDMMAKIVRLSLSANHPRQHPVAAGLATAGKSSSLLRQFFAPGTGAGVGRVRAKLGRLTGVHALAGYVRTNDGSIAIFDFVINKTTNDYDAEVWTQRAAAAVTRCGCHL